MKIVRKVKNYADWKIQSKKKGKAFSDALSNGNVIGRYPLNLQIQTVSACNGKCYFCPYNESWHKRNPGKMSAQTYHRIIEEVSRFQIGKFCPYLENEPLLDPDLFPKIEYALERISPGLVEISSNFSVLKKSVLDDLANLLSPIQHRILVSFHGIDKETYHSIMGLDFEQSLENVLALVEKSQTEPLNIFIRGSGVARSQSNRMPNWFGKTEYFAFWGDQLKKHGFKRIPEISFFTYHDRAGQIKRNQVNFNKTVRSSLKGFYCHRMDQWLHFLYNGELILCCMDYSRCTKFGSIEESSIDEIFKSEEYLSLARKMTGMENSGDDFICKKCISPLDGVV